MSCIPFRNQHPNNAQKEDERNLKKFPKREQIDIFENHCETMRVIAKRALRDFWLRHSDSENALKSWYRETEKSEWNSINDLKRVYPSASILNDRRIVINIKGNKYRLIVKFNFEYQIAWIRFVGTHTEYDKIDANTI